MATNGKKPSVARLFDRRKLRQATLVLPTTGERVHRTVTLHDPALFGDTDERAPLLPKADQAPPPSKWHRIRQWSIEEAKQAWEFCKTPTAQGIFKCSLAYLIATLATFSLPVASILGTHQDGNQLVANIVVWFDPARSAGSMDLGVCFAFVAFLYGCAVAFGGQAVSAFFASQDMLVAGHTVVLLVFCWGGLGLLAWFKQYMSHPLVNTASSLASLAIVTCLTKEGVVQTGDFSYFKLIQVLKMLIAGIIISGVINLIIWPVSARRNLRETLVKTTDAFGDLLTTITAAFLSGLEEDTKHPAMVTASDKFKSVFGALPQQLAEAGYEHHPLGTEAQYHIESRLVDCVQRLAQDMGGLRSAAAAQFQLLSQDTELPAGKSQQPATNIDTVTGQAMQPAQLGPSTFVKPAPAGGGTGTGQTSDPNAGANAAGATSTFDVGPSSEHESNQGNEPGGTLDGQFMSRFGSRLRKVSTAPAAPSHAQDQAADANSLHSSSSTGSVVNTQPSSRRQNPFIGSAQTPVEVFETFIEHLGPPMRSLAYTLREILKALPYGAYADRPAGNLQRFRHSLYDAIELFNVSRREALDLVYRSKELTEARSVEVAADFEEVAASCGHFSSSLSDFAENCLTYLEILDELELEITERPRGRTWTWLLFWRNQSLRDWLKGRNGEEAEAKPSQTSVFNVTSIYSDQGYAGQKFPYRLYPCFAWFRREDVKFAIKVGAGATFYAMFSFIPDTKPFYDHWHLEWGLVSYMLVCSMNIGASNTTAWSRSYGTVFGALVAIIVWIICQENAAALAFCGWLVSLVCFYFIIAKSQGPMGRFILLTYNLSVLYSFALSIQDPDADEGEREPMISMQIFEIAMHRLVAVLLGVVGGVIVTHYIWPISARRKIQQGVSLLWLRVGLIWLRGPLTILTEGSSSIPHYMDLRKEVKLRQYLDSLDSLRKSAESEFELRGPFPSNTYDQILQSTGRMLDALHALNVVVSKDLKATPGEAEILQYTLKEREEVARRICHMLSASLALEYPLAESLPKIDHVRDRLLAKLFEFRKFAEKKSNPTDEDYELLYCYGESMATNQLIPALVTGQIAHEVEVSGAELVKLFQALGGKVITLQ